MQYPALLLKQKLRNWILLVVWLCTVVWFLNTASKYGHPLKESPRATPSNTTSPISSPDRPKINSNKAAVIVETRHSGKLIPLILHFSAVLGPTWPVIIYTTAENYGTFSTSAALHRYQANGRVIVRSLAPGVFFPFWSTVSAFLTGPWLWEDLAPIEHLLIFQADSVLCSNSVRSVDDFLQYDLIGAPIGGGWGRGYNGGLSLRRRSTVMRAVQGFLWDGDKPEDQWFYERFEDLRKDDELEGNVTRPINLPDMEIARTFAVETIDYPFPLGLHQPTRYIQEQNHMVSLDEWCPEWRLALTERIQE